MLVYLLKSGACMAIFLLFYQLFLEREKMHVFKRFYLIAAITAALIIPNIVFTSYVEMATSDAYAATTNKTYVAQLTTNSKDANMLNWTLILGTIYAIGVILFSFRFFRHLLQIITRIKRNPNFRQQTTIKVLLTETIPPHTFFKYIFLNKKRFEENTIPEEVLLHEETHAKQGHSIDVLFIELMQVFLWFNPLVHLFKKAIKLNHEFLADDAVLKEDAYKNKYQNTLLSYLSQDSLEKYQSTGIANAINYSSIKKRFTVMKKQTSKKAVLLRGALVFPLMGLLLFGFTESNTIEINTKNIPASTIETSNKTFEFQQAEENKTPTLEDFTKWKNSKNYALWLDGKKINNTVLENYTPEQITYYSSSFVYDNARNKNYPQPYQVGLYTENGYAKLNGANSIQININKNGKLLMNEDVVDILDFEDLLIAKIKSIETNPKDIPIRLNYDLNAPQHIINEIISLVNFHIYGKTNTKPINFSLSATKQEITNYNTLAKKYNAIPIEKRKIPVKDLNVLEGIYNQMTKAQQTEAQPFPECILKTTQDSATRAQMATYNALAKKYNDMDSSRMRILKKDVEKLAYIYGLMSKKQKENAEPFPDFPEPPPAPRIFKGQVSNIPPPPSRRVLKGEVTTIPPSPSPRVLKGEVSSIPPPPLPPKPLDPLDHIVAMAKKGATFMYEGQQISSDKAIDLLKTNKRLHLDIKNSNGKKPVVKLSKEPI